MVRSANRRPGDISSAHFPAVSYFDHFFFLRSFAQDSLIIYASLPMAVYLACYFMGLVREKSRRGPALVTVGVGIGYGYYYAFSLILLVFAFVFGWLRGKEKKETPANLFTDSLRWSYGADRGHNRVERALNIGGGAEILEFYDSLGVAPIISTEQKLCVYVIPGTATGGALS